jgi:hypothetical protein
LQLAARLAGLALLCIGVCACASSSSYLLVGTPRPPISADAVRVLVRTPSDPYEEIALLETSSARSLAWSEQAKIDRVIRRLQSEAARLGANAIVVHVLADGVPASIGAGLGAGLVGTHGTVAIGAGGSAQGGAEKIGRATAIYLPPRAAATMNP